MDCLGGFGIFPRTKNALLLNFYFDLTEKFLNDYYQNLKTSM